MSNLQITKQDITDIIQRELAPILRDIVTIKDDIAVVKQDVAAVKQDVAAVKQDVAAVKEEIAAVKQDVAAVKQDVAAVKHEVKVLAAKQMNSTKGRDDPLERVPFPIGAVAYGDGAYPATLAHLSIAGNENLPNDEKNMWNARNSRNLLLTYGEGSESEGEIDEMHPSARRRRIKLARRLGITTAQLNHANIIL